MLLISEHYGHKPIFEEVKGRKGVLSVLKDAELGFFGKENKNKRIYTRELWDKNVLKNESVMDKINNRRCYGQLGHPAGIQVQEERIATVLTSFRIDENTGMIKGDIEILDTPAGRIAHTLAKAECGLGTSTRGGGEEKQVKGKTYVSEESYIFGGVDLVADPSNGTFPKLGESEKEFILESVRDNKALVENDGEYYKDLFGKLGMLKEQTPEDLNADNHEVPADSAEEDNESSENADSSDAAPVVPGEEDADSDDKVVDEETKVLLNRMRTRILELTDEVEEEKDRNVSLLKQKNEEIQTLKGRIKQLAVELEKAEATVSELMHEKETEDREIASLTEGSHNDPDTLVLLTKENRALKRQVEEQHEQLEDTVSLTEDLKMGIQAEKVTVESLQTQLEDERSLNTDLYAKLVCLEKNIRFEDLLENVEDLSCVEEVDKIARLLSTKRSASLGYIPEAVHSDMDEISEVRTKVGTISKRINGGK